MEDVVEDYCFSMTLVFNPRRGRIYGEPWYANMTCCDCGGGKMVNTFVPYVLRVYASLLCSVKTASILSFDSILIPL